MDRCALLPWRAAPDGLIPACVTAPTALSDAAEAVARDLLQIGAVALRPAEPFTWASGRLSPVYTDNRLTLAYPEVRARLTNAFAALVGGLPAPPDVIAGTATAGIPHAAWLADRLGLPMAYVRARPKGHGRGNQIEGRVDRGQGVVLVEDLISTGGSVADAGRALRDAGAHVDAVLAVFTYGLPESADALAHDGYAVRALTDLATLARVARQDGSLGDEDLDTLDAWRADPGAWSAARGGAS